VPPFVDLRDLLRLLYAEHFLCLECIARRLAIEPAEATTLLQQLRDKIAVHEVQAACPRCYGVRRLFTLGG
jgi:hypothetical protein